MALMWTIEESILLQIFISLTTVVLTEHFSYQVCQVSASRVLVTTQLLLSNITKKPKKPHYNSKNTS